MRRHDGQTFDAELAGWDPTTRLVVLRVPSLGTPALKPAAATVARRAHRAGPRAILEQRRHRQRGDRRRDWRSSADGPATARSIRSSGRPRRCTAALRAAPSSTQAARWSELQRRRYSGLGVIIPTEHCLEDRRDRPRARSAETRLSGHRRAGREAARKPCTDADGRTDALLVVGVTDGSPAARAGVLVGDVLLALGEKPVRSPEDLLDLLVETPIGAQAVLRVLRGGTRVNLAVTVGERPQ